MQLLTIQQTKLLYNVEKYTNLIKTKVVYFRAVPSILAKNVDVCRCTSRVLCHGDIRQSAWTVSERLYSLKYGTFSLT